MQGAQTGLLAGPPMVAAAVSHRGGWQIAPWVLLVVSLLAVGLSLGVRFLEKRKTV